MDHSVLVPLERVISASIDIILQLLFLYVPNACMNYVTISCVLLDSGGGFFFISFLTVPFNFPSCISCVAIHYLTDRTGSN